MEDSPLEFARIYWLYAGVGLCVAIVALFFLFDRRREEALAKLVHSRFRRRLVPGHSPGMVRVKRSLWVLGVLLLGVAAAGPRKGYEEREVRRKGIDILFAIDTSRSMLAEDLTPNRLERARMGIHDFLSRLEGDRVGLIPFAGSSLALCPLTTDYDAFRDGLDALNTDIIPRQGTDVASAIREAERLFAEQNNNYRVLVLITDGEDLQGDAIQEAEAAAKNGTRIYPIGVGSTEGATIPLRQEDGTTELVRDDKGNPVVTKLDEETLKKIAGLTGGLYAPLGRGAEGLDTVYREKLRLVPKNQTELRTEKVPLERFEWPLGAAILLFIMEFLLPDRRRESKPAPLPSAARRHPASLPVILTAAGLLFTAAAGKVSAAEEVKDSRVTYNEGTAKYNEGKFEEAVRILQSGLNTPDLALQNRMYYNLGNALYRVGQEQKKKSKKKALKTWEEAMKSYTAALTLNSDDKEARHNLDLVTRKWEELKRKRGGKGGGQGGAGEESEEGDEGEGESGQDGNSQKKNEGGDQKKDEGSGQEGKGKDGQKGSGEDAEQTPSKEGSGEQKENPEGKDASGETQDGSKEGDKNSPGTGAAQQKDGTGNSPEKENGQPSGKEGGEKDQPGSTDGGEKDMKDPREGDKEAAGTGSGEKKDDAKEAGGKDGVQEAKGGDKSGGGKDEDKNKTATGGKDDMEKAGPEGKPAEMSEVRRKPGEMTAEEARMLLQSLRSDERTVIPGSQSQPPRRQGRFRDPNNTTRGKTW